MNIFVSVFTPTYNRAHTLYRVYESLLVQTNKNFEWIIVDDGSTDNTKDLIASWCHDNSLFNIKYYYQKNSGKHIAINNALSLSIGELFLIADSDDIFSTQTIMIFTTEWQTVKDRGLDDQIRGIWCLCQDENEAIIGDRFPKNNEAYTFSELFYKERITGEKWHIERTSAMRENLFPVTQEPFVYYVPESIIWSKIYYSHKMLCLNVPLRTYIKEKDGLMMEKINIKNYYSQRLYIISLLNEQIAFFYYYPFFFFKQTLLLFYFSYRFKQPFQEVYRQIQTNFGKLLFLISLLLYPFAILLKKLTK